VIAELDPRLQHWLCCEQTINERIINDAVLGPIDRRSNTVRAAYCPEHRPIWPQKVVWLPEGQSRTYGNLRTALRDAFGYDLPANKTPLLLHPQLPPAHRKLSGVYGASNFGEVWATPTASYRSVLAWRRGRFPALLKLSIGAVIGRRRRALREAQIIGGVLMSAVFDTIPDTDRERLGFDWFSDPAGAVETLSGHGWLLRRLPRMVTGAGAGRLVPMFSLISVRGDHVPLLVDLIRRAGQAPERFVVDRLIRPYVNILAYLLFDQGIQIEGHSQNVLFETDNNGELTGRLVLRDMSDASLSVPFRVARRKPLPVFDPGFFPDGAPVPLASMATDYVCNFGRSWLFRAYDTVERYGLWGFIWSLNTSLARFFPTYDAAAVEDIYLTFWQDAAIQYLGVRPLFRKEPKGLATDEALAYFLRRVDWSSLGCTGGASLPSSAEPLLIERRARRRAKPVYERLECSWGELFFLGGLPAFFRPAF
jgi:IucA / IucC family